MGKIDLKDKRNVYAIIVCLLIMAAAHLVYNYVWDPFTYQRESLERDLQSAQAELDKINAKKHRVAELEMQLAQAEKDFEKLKEMFPDIRILAMIPDMRLSEKKGYYYSSYYGDKKKGGK